MTLKKITSKFRYIILFIFSVHIHALEIKITNGEWTPLLSPKMKHYGLASHIISEAFLLEGVKVNYGFFPWARAYKLAVSGKWDATAIWQSNDERISKFLFSDPVLMTRNVYFHLKKKKIVWSSIEDLKEYRIGATLNYFYGKEFEMAEKNKILKVEREATDEINFKKLFYGRIDIFPLDIVVGYSMIRKLYPNENADKFTNHPKIILEKPLHLLISKNSKKAEIFIKKFNSGLKKLKKSGRFEEFKQNLKKGDYEK